MTDPDDPDAKRRWLGRLLDLIPERLRPNRHDQRFLDAAALAYRNGWQPDQLAKLVTDLDYSRSRNPPYILITRIEAVGSSPPKQQHPHTPGRRHPNGCIVCPPGTTCEDPVTHTTPPDQTIGRWRLIHRLLNTPTPGMTDSQRASLPDVPDMNEEERSHAMTNLIAEQRAHG